MFKFEGMKKKKGNRTERRLNSAIQQLSERDKKLMERYEKIKEQKA